MTDIVGRLRDRSDHYIAQHAMDTMDEAAAEIERLRAALVALADSYEKNYDRGDGDRYSPWEEDAFRDAKAIIDGQSTSKEG